MLRKCLSQDKETASLVLESKLRSLPLIVDGYNFSFKYSRSRSPKRTVFLLKNPRAYCRAFGPRQRSFWK
jgi:hypothetical protein